MTKALYDKNGREMQVGDVLKVFHFTGARKKKYYMYKQIVSCVMLGKSGAEFFKVSHLSLDRDRPYLLHIDGRVLHDYEIVQSTVDDYEDREKLSINNKA